MGFYEYRLLQKLWGVHKMDQLSATSEPGFTTVKALLDKHGVEKQPHEIDKGCRTCPIQFCSPRSKGKCIGIDNCPAYRDYMKEFDGE